MVRISINSKEQLRPFLRTAKVYQLTEQPCRDGKGARWCAFQYSLAKEDRHLLFVFRLPGGEKEHAIRLQGLQPHHLYSISGFEGEFLGKHTGQELMETGIIFGSIEEEGSELMKID